MKKVARIISSDARFVRMLTLELIELGITVVSDFTDEPDTFCYTIADLDICEQDTLREMSESSHLIGFSQKQEDEIVDRKSICATFLHRPFPMSEFVSVFGITEKPRQTEIHEKLRQTPKAANRLSLDHREKSAKYGDVQISLSECEYLVLSALFENRGELVPRERIYALLGAEDGNIGDVYICHLRRKIDNKFGVKMIYTVRGKGYMLKN